MQQLIWAVLLAGAIASRYFLGVTGGVVYAALVLVTIGLFRRQLSIGLTHVASKLGLMRGMIDRMPSTIKLVRAPAMDEAAQPVAAELAGAGFIDAGAWDIPPMPKIKLALMVHPAENFVAAIETASVIGAQVNVHTLYSDGKVMTFTNSKMPAPAAQWPELTCIRMPGASVRALLSKARTARRQDRISAISVTEAPTIYQRLYSESIRYRKMKGA